VRVQYTLPILFFDIALPGFGEIPDAYKTVSTEVTTMIECEPPTGENVCL
jgi:hypothetical protein